MVVKGTRALLPLSLRKGWGESMYSWGQQKGKEIYGNPLFRGGEIHGKGIISSGRLLRALQNGAGPNSRNG